MPPRHYRFGRAAEDAAEGCEMIVGALDHSPWLCMICNEYTHNTAYWERCVVCNEARGDWLCEFDAHRNPATATVCQECGRPNPDAT